jgi:hypothetical protein
MLQIMKSVGQPLSTFIVQPILKGMIESIGPTFFHGDHGGFTITR